MPAAFPSRPPSDASRASAHPAAGFWDRMAARYAARPVEDPAAYAMKLDMMSDLLRDRPGSQVVEIGCGTGSTALTLAPHADRIRAADVSAAMIEIARDKARDIDPEKLSFEVAAFEDLAVAEGSQDMVMAHSLLHLLERRDAAIAAAHRWLRPGGVFVSSTPCLSEVAPWLRLVAPLARAAGLFPPALGFFTEAELVGALKAHGFEIERRFRPDTRAATFLVARKPA